ncbi:hypothetical protein F01_260301 [Burkholderia cenocepacia]|nr:hypothetical protein F01_260301 [Burkholderia cenocepacia]
MIAAVMRSVPSTLKCCQRMLETRRHTEARIDERAPAIHIITRKSRRDIMLIRPQDVDRVLIQTNDSVVARR